ncbi:MAG TPA: glycosyltransferase family 4 protein [Solirubrobacteraceae bacterium]|jgi:glycosyltransferase involved in cell wall biosynthesis|nr:glycosyltransferase family 4 protein [Solirubrobacteraceae bacterium]
MTTPPETPRLIGVSIPDVSDREQALPTGQWSRFFRALGQRVTVVDVIQPKLTQAQELLNRAINFHPDLVRWKAQAGFNLKRVQVLTRMVERELVRAAGSYDLVIQLQTVCRPGLPSAGRPYVIYTDNTFALTQRFYAQWAPVSHSRVRRWTAFEADVCRSAEHVFTFSEFARRSVIDDYRCEPSQVTAIGAGANQLREAIPVRQPGDPTALFVGRRFELKGGLTLLRAWSRVREQIPTAQLVIAGPDHGPPNGLGPGVRWLGRVDRAQLDKLYADASVFVLPSMFEAWGHVFVEAMGYGLPCIGTTRCAMPEIIEGGTTGLLVSPAEDESLAQALIDLLGDPQKAQEMGRRGHARVLERFTWEHVAARLVAALVGVETGQRR